MSTLDKKTVKKVATLARIEMTDEDLDKMAPKIESIISWVEQLEEVDTANVEPLSSVANITLPLRKDIVNDGACADKVLKNAPETTQGYFVVSKIVE